MADVKVWVDASAAVEMFNRIVSQTRDLDIRAAAEDLLSSVRVAQDTGALQDSMRLDVQSPKWYRVVSDLEYAKFVFWGHRDRGGGWVDAQPPEIGFGIDTLANLVTDQVFR